ncbi:AAA family ATPase [Maridesulfovibrio frigidus]|uniref:AAA family ATPase n=1 Tax=Maridesulfovibrio frigidus TaxID=340956 RepID=UPI0004E24419|nr:AAA family ATPase [Maridesulfovibrio frigidus]
MYVEKLSLKNFRGIRDLDIEFDKRLNVLVGDNGCGKSTILVAIVRGLIGSRLNHVAGDERTSLENMLQIQPFDIFNSTDHALRTLCFNREGKSISVTGSSSPDDFKSTLKDEFSRVDFIERAYFPAERGVGFSDSPPDSHIREVVRKDSRLNLMLVNNASYSYAFDWIKTQEDFENAAFRSYVDDGNQPKTFNLNPKLQAVKQVVENITGLSRITYSNTKNSVEVVKGIGDKRISLTLDQLSLGEHVFVGLIAAIAVSVVIDVVDGTNPLEAEHILIIDEIDLHLHPKWQRKVIPALLENFPKCQFIVTTHSPQILSEVSADNIISLYRDANGDIQYEKPVRSKGLSVSDVLTEVMGQDEFTESLETDLEAIYEYIEDEKFDDARDLIKKNEIEFGEIPALIEARTMLELSE